MQKSRVNKISKLRISIILFFSFASGSNKPCKALKLYSYNPMLLHLNFFTFSVISSGIVSIFVGIYTLILKVELLDKKVHSKGF